MLTIYKYPLNSFHVEEIDLPKGAKPLTVQVQAGQPCLWALVDPDQPREKRTFLTFGTGHHVGDEAGAYIGTFQMLDDTLVFHLFEARRP